MIAWVGLALLGGLGAVARDLLEARIGLLWVNVIGSGLLGAAAGATGDARFLIATGFLGAFTSFSGWTVRPRPEGVLALALGLAAAALAKGLLGP